MVVGDDGVGGLQALANNSNVVTIKTETLSGAYTNLHKMGITLRSQLHIKPHSVFTGTIVIEIICHPIQLDLPWLNPETHLGVKCNRTRVNRRCNAMDHATLILAHNCKETLVQPPAEAAFAVLGVHSDEMNVCFLRVALRKKTDQESLDPPIFF